MYNLITFTSLIFLINQSDIVTGLIVVVIFFAILLLLGVRKSYKLKKENERLEALNNDMGDDDEDKPYKDFTEGHLYDNNN
ncbi:hypothetical protein MBM09_10470 [Flaviramulus sp. BrNp1-15]|uniref:hypothetical protein n=1 Tax=Flaviramulus sp. BrNp1-15 TaxID=2916754 RepID=UPI001EE8CF8D|nr:hypothetical protein [Flaviramulus sp. BrNp1-15]ULC58345.1 hypothetical protein MBM09_10470 [Flaviramulus sp. BrNp1-15]